MFIDGLLIPVGNLINGTTITRSEAREFYELEYLNIKVEGHDVIYAEGAPVETLREVDELRNQFRRVFPDIRQSKSAREALCSMGFIRRRSRRTEFEIPQRDFALA